MNNIENGIYDAHNKKVNLPKNDDGNINYGAVGQFAVSDGQVRHMEVQYE